jgi:hypothetical protein
MGLWKLKKSKSFLTGLAIGTVLGSTYMVLRVARNSTNEQQALTTKMLALPPSSAPVNKRDEYIRAFEKARGELRGQDIIGVWKMEKLASKTAIEILAKRDATTQSLLERGDPYAALRTANTMAGMVVDVIGIPLVEEVAFAYSMRDATGAVAAVKGELPRPTQLRVLEFLEGASALVYPEVSILAHLQYVHEEANPQHTWAALEKIKAPPASINIVMPKAHRKTLFQAIAKYLGGKYLNMQVINAIGRSDDRWSAAEAMLEIIPADRAYDVLGQIITLPGWERQEALIARLTRKWALVEKTDIVEKWIDKNCAGRTKLDALRELRNGMLTKGEYERATEICTMLRDELNDHEAFDPDNTSLQSAIVRAAALSQVRLEEALTLLSEWGLDAAKVHELRSQEYLTPEAAASLSAWEKAKVCNSESDWVAALRDSTAGGDANLSAALAVIVTREKWPLAVQLANAAASDSQSNQILQVYVGQAGFALYGGEYFTNEKALVEAGSIPVAADARAYAFDQWLVNDIEAASGWLTENFQDERNGALVTTLIEHLQHGDPESAVAWIGTLKSTEEKNKALESLEAISRKSM